MPFDVTVEWSSRSKTLQARLTKKVSGVSFWLLPTTTPVGWGFVAPADIGSWSTAKTTAMAVTTNVATQTATVTVPDGIAHLRLDFDLVATIGSHSSTVLSLRQLFEVFRSESPPGVVANGTLAPLQFSFEDVILVPSDKGPKRSKGTSPNGRKSGVGVHPLLSIGGVGRLSVNAEFVDVTELWWKVHPDTTWGWYWHPDVKGRQEHLRVLAWTGGGDPMIWFAVIPDAAVGSSGAGRPPADASAATATPGTPADIVFVRPPPGSNSFPYSPTPAGFEAKQHDDTTLVNLARYLLGPVSEKTFLALQSAGVRTPELLVDVIQPKATTPTLQPSDPMWLMRLSDTPNGPARAEAFTDGRANAFRPVGLEVALNRSGGAHVLFLPLGFSASRGDASKGIPAHPGGYEAVVRPGLKATLQSALSLLWSTNAMGRDRTIPLQTRERELWLAGHSEGNLKVWECLTANAADVDRLISFDANTLPAGIEAMATAGPKRPRDKPLHAFVIMTPANGDPTGLPVATDTALRALRKKGVLVTPLPDIAVQADYWHLNPPPITNPYFLYLLAKWNVPAKPGNPRTWLDISATTPGKWGFLFFHELAIFGGTLIQPAAGAAGAPPAPPFVRTFFEMALGAPNPRPP